MTTPGAFLKDERPFVMVGLVLAAAAVVWAALLPAAAYAASHRADEPLAHLLAVAVYRFGGAICHQRPDRSFHFLAEQLPVCARCTGLYVGAAVLGVSYVWLWRGSESARAFVVTRTGSVRLWLAVAAVPIAASLVYEWTTGSVPSNLVRAGTGLVLGGAVAYVILAALDSTR